MKRLPEIIPKEFLEDCLTFSNIFHTDGVAALVHGQEHQQEMCDRYPEEWMDYLFDKVGRYEEDEDE